MADSNDKGKKYKFFKPISSIKKLLALRTKESEGRHNTIFLFNDFK